MFGHRQQSMYCNVCRHILLTSGLRMQIAVNINNLQVTLSAEDLAVTISEIMVTS